MIVASLVKNVAALSVQLLKLVAALTKPAVKLANAAKLEKNAFVLIALLRNKETVAMTKHVASRVTAASQGNLANARTALPLKEPNVVRAQRNNYE